MQCTGGLESYGKRRKRALVGPEMTIQLTTPMSPEADFKVAEAAEAAVAGEASNVDAGGTKDSSSSESRKFHAQLILFVRPRLAMPSRPNGIQASPRPKT